MLALKKRKSITLNSNAVAWIPPKRQRNIVSVVSQQSLPRWRRWKAPSHLAIGRLPQKKRTGFQHGHGSMLTWSHMPTWTKVYSKSMRWSTCQAPKPTLRRNREIWNRLFPRTSWQRWWYKGQLGPLLLHLQRITARLENYWCCQLNAEDDANSEVLKNLWRHLPVAKREWHETWLLMDEILDGWSWSAFEPYAQWYVITYQLVSALFPIQKAFRGETLHSHNPRIHRIRTRSTTQLHLPLLFSLATGKSCCCAHSIHTQTISLRFTQEQQSPTPSMASSLPTVFLMETW